MAKKSKFTTDHPIYIRIIGACLIGPLVLGTIIDFWMGLVDYQSAWYLNIPSADILTYTSPFVALIILGIDILIISGFSLTPKESWRRIKQRWWQMLLVLLVIIALNVVAVFAAQDVMNFFI